MSAESARKQPFEVVRPSSGEYKVVGRPLARPAQAFHYRAKHPGMTYIQLYAPRDADRVPPIRPDQGTRLILDDGTIVLILREPLD